MGKERDKEGMEGSDGKGGGPQGSLVMGIGGQGTRWCRERRKGFEMVEEENTVYLKYNKCFGHLVKVT